MNESSMNHLLERLPTFDKLVSSLQRGKKFEKIKKVQQSVSGNCADGQEQRFPLEEAELKSPDYWVPVAFDGYKWSIFPCCPPWLESTCSDVTPIGRTIGDIDREEDLMLQPEAFLFSEYQALRNLERKRVNAWEALEGSKPEQATEEQLLAAESVLSSPPNSVEELEAGLALEHLDKACREAGIGGKEEPVIPNSIAVITRIIALAYKAGRHAEKADIYRHRLPEGNRFVSRKGKGRQRRKKRPEEDLAPSEAAIVAWLRSGDTEDTIIALLKENKFADEPEPDMILIRGEKKSIQEDSLKKRIRKLKKEYCSETSEPGF